ncbi:NHLP bacteriocin system secretion protein [Desulforhopalus sp. 52FAK]
MSSDKLFRKKALQKLSSPEQLDTTVKLIPSAGWLSLLALGLFTLVIVLWGFLGSLKYPQSGIGVIVSGDRVHSVYSTGTGIVNAMAVEVGDYVQYGQIIGRIDLPEQINDIVEIKNKIILLHKEYEEIKAMDEKYLDVIKGYYDAQISSSKEQVGELEQIFTWYEGFLSNAEGVKNMGIISDYSLQQQRQDYTNLLNNLSNMRNNQLNYDAQKQDTVFTQRKDHFSRMENIKEQIYHTGTQIKDLMSQSFITSYSQGYVQEILAYQGDLVSANQAVITLSESTEKGLKAVLYFSTIEGKGVQYGMDAQVTPTFLKAEDYGSIKGLVMTSSPYPVSQAEIDQTLLNASLSTVVINSTGGSPYKVEVSLLTSSNTYSGYKWTSSKGPPLKIKQGTLITGSVITRTEKPINLVVEIFRRYFLGIGQREFEITQQI